MKKTLSVVIPCHNEIDNIEKILNKVINEKTDKEIIVVDDGSTDGSREVISSFGEDRVKAIFLNGCHGKGYAVRQGIAQADGKYLIIQDSDFEYNPDEYGKLLEMLECGKADCVYGNRFENGKPENGMLSAYMGNRFLTIMADVLFGMHLRDMQTCYKMFRTQDIKGFKLCENRFTIDIEITLNAAVRKMKFGQVPISYSPRGYAQGKKINYVDFFEAVFFILTKFISKMSGEI